VTHANLEPLSRFLIPLASDSIDPSVSCAILPGMSPTIFRAKGFRFYFFSLEEDRMHVHVKGPDGDAKFWLEPKVELAIQHGLAGHQVSEIRQLVEEHRDEIRNAWQQHIGR